MLPGIGEVMERRIWQNGVPDWESFLQAINIKGISKKRKRYFNTKLEQIMEQTHDHTFLADFFPHNLHWRLFPNLVDRAAFLDIETTGLSFRSHTTLVGIYRMYDEKMFSLVKGLGLNSGTISDALKDVSIIVTYNGSSFDLPMIRHHFPGALSKIPHFDLRFAARRVGYTGGLKSLERELGITRDYEVENLAGEDALIFWKMWKKDRNRNALRLLRKYNREDVMNMIPIANILYGKLEEQTLGGIKILTQR